jgi:hypothetical protein
MPFEPSLGLTAVFVLVCVLIGIYIGSELISKMNRTPYDWAAGSYMIEEACDPGK